MGFEDLEGQGLTVCLREVGEELTAIEMAEAGYPEMLSWGDDFKDPLQQHHPLELSVGTDMS